ncbi:MAG: right-handed parallel beta-helix repeat-containing protein [bacterium]|nr:right-handed parallel beta-helix repeat-containing protein [bacterium]
MGRKREFLLGSLLCLVLLFFDLMSHPYIAFGRDLRVPRDYPLIQRAIDASSSGDRILVAEGTYLEQVRLKPGIKLEGGWSKQFTQRDPQKYQTIIDAKGKEGWAVLAASNTVFDGFIVQNATQVKTEKEEYGSGLYCLSVQEVIIRNNIFRQNEPSGIYAGSSQLTIVGNHILKNAKAGIHLEKGSTLLIRSNIIESNKEAGISTLSKIPNRIEVFGNRVFHNGRGGIDCQNATGKVYNNVVYENKEAGIRGCIVPLEVINNTVVGNAQAGVSIDDQSKEIIIKNNIIAFNGESGIMSAQRGYSYNLLFANAEGEYCDPNLLPCIRSQHAGYEDEESFRKIGHIIADPMFVDAKSHNYHLLPGSPAIDAGDGNPVYADKNFPPSLGSERNDLGAYGGPYTVAEERAAANRPPLARAEISSPIFVGDTVRLDASASSDPDGDALKIQWALLSAPPGSKAKIFRADGPKSSFQADLAGEYRVSLKLVDRWGAQAETILSAKVEKNHPPTAYAGEDLEAVSVGDTIKVSGEVSSDDDGDRLSFWWEFAAKPEKSRARLSDPTSASPFFIVDQPGCYILRLTVDDGQVKSLPDEILINTVYEAPDRIRHVPAQYPTIQSAVDAARAGDTILVQAGTYRENVYIDKQVNLKGVGWPVIDGGGKPGNVDTVKIDSLGEQAGRIEGFVITGGGSGPLAHGLSAWDSAPTICNNQFTGNLNNGLGLHGRQLLTEKAQVYGNLVYGNKGGIGNGRGSCANIHHNYIFRNSVFGIGCRGFSAPRIEHNYIFENDIGIGMREVSSPKIVGNYIYHNKRGIVLSPVSTVKASAGEDILVQNNLIFQNQKSGLMASSFNLSRLLIINNTIDSNGREKPSRQAGGIILGWPWPARFEAVIQNNVITNNSGAGVLNYPGPQDVRGAGDEAGAEVRSAAAPAGESKRLGGAKLLLSHNNLWNNTENYSGCLAADQDILQDPLFIAKGPQPWMCYFLSQTSAGQSRNSPCVDAAVQVAATLSPYLKNLAQYTTRADLKPDAAALDLGFHYLAAECGQDLPALVKEKLEGGSK